jgi:hypothetical protein
MNKLRTLSIIIGALVAIIIFLSWGCSPHTFAPDIEQIRFFQLGHIPVAQGKINGKLAYFIIDTGASCSILDEELATRYGFKLIMQGGHDVLGLGGQAKLKLIRDCLVEIGPLKFSNFHSKPLGYLTSVIQEDKAVCISGIIGADVLNRYSLKIDFRNNLLCFK